MTPGAAVRTTPSSAAQKALVPVTFDNGAAVVKKFHPVRAVPPGVTVNV
jgi:hypothetical protein